MANKSGLNKESDFNLIYKGDNVTQALTQIKSKDNFEYSTIVLLCTSQYVFLT